VDRYFDRRAWNEKFGGVPRPVVDRHRTLEDYVSRVLLGARFELTEFLKPVATEEEVRQSARI
jgi:hypothetical protein